MAGVEVDLSYHLRREYFDRDESRHSRVYTLGSNGAAMIPASDYSFAEGAEMASAVTASDRSFVSDVEGPGSEVTSAAPEEKIKKFSSIFRASEKPAINSYIMTVIQSDHDYSHHWSCNPDNKSSTQQANVVNLFASSDASKPNCWHNSSIQELDDQDVDIEGDWNDGVPSVPYNDKLARKLMLECERHMEFAGGDAAAVAEKQAQAEENGILSDTEEEEEDAGDDDAASSKDLNLCKAGWTAQQERAFDRAVAILDGERLARLACAGVQHEPARRRALLDRSACKFRRLLSGECRWELSLCRWLHNTLLHTLSSSYLISYLDILQSLSYALPSLMDKLVAPSSKSGVGKKVAGGSGLNTPSASLGTVSFSPSLTTDGTAANFDCNGGGKFTPAHFSVTDSADPGAPPSGNAVPSSRQTSVGTGGALDASPCSALTAHCNPAASDAQNYGFGGSISSVGLSLLLKRPWDPAMPVLHSNKPQSLGSGSAVVVLVPHCPRLSPASARRHKTFASTLHRVTTTVTITVPPPPGGRLQEWLESAVAAVVTAVQEWRARGRAVVLAGWRAGGLLAAQIAAANPSVEGVVCLSPPFSDSADYTPANDPASDRRAGGQAPSSVTTADILCALTCPLLLVIGDRSHSANVGAVEQLRERLPGGMSQLVVLRGADNELRLHPLQRYRAALTNSLVDRCIVDEIGCFISNMIVKEEVTAEAVTAATKVHETATFPSAESPAPSAGVDSYLTDVTTGEVLVKAKRKACDEAPVPDAGGVLLHASPKKLRQETSVAVDDGLLPHGLPVVSMAVISSTTSTLPSSGAAVAASVLPTASPAAPSKDVTEALWSKPSSESSTPSARGSNRRGRRAGRGRGRGSRAPLPGQLIALGGGVGVAAQAHLKSAGRRQSVLAGRGGAARGLHSFMGRSSYASASPSVSDSDVMLVSPVSSRPKMAPSRPVSIKEQVAQAAQSEAQLLAAVASITPQSPPESQAPSKITTVSTSNVVRSPNPMTNVTQAVEFLERSNSQQPQQVHYMLHPQQILSSSSSAPIVVGNIGELSSTAKAVSADVTFTSSMMNITSGSLADKRKSIPSIMSNVGDRRKNLTASAGTSGNKKPIIFQTSGGGLFSTTNRIILPSTVSSVSSNLPSLIVSSSSCIVPSLAPIKKLIRPSLAHSAQRMTAPVVLSNQKSVPSFVTSPKPSVTFINSTKVDSGPKSGQTSISDRKTLINNPNPGSTLVANQKGGSTFVASHKGSAPAPNQKLGVSPQPVPQIIGTLRGGRVSLNSDVVASGVLQGVPTIISGARFISTRGALKGSMTRGGIVQARTLATSSGRGIGVTSRQLITVAGTTSSPGDTVSASSALVTKGHNIVLTTLAANISKPLPVSSPLTTDASLCTSPSPGTVLSLDASKSISSVSKSLPQTPVGVKQLLLELPHGSEKTFKILPQKSQHVLKIADKPLQGHAKILVSSQKAAQFCYKPIVVQKKNLVSKMIAQGDHLVPLQPKSQSSVSSEPPKQVTVSTTTSTTVRISTAADAVLASSVQTNTSLVVASSVLPSLECLDPTSAVTTSVSTRNVLPVTATVSLPVSVDQSLTKSTSISPFVPESGSLNDSPASLTEKLDLLAAAASEISQKLIPHPSLESSEILFEKGNNSAQSQQSSALTFPLSTFSNFVPSQGKKDQLIEVSLEEVPKLDVPISQPNSNSVGILFRGSDANLIPFEQFSYKTDSLPGPSMDKVESATTVAGRSEEGQSACKTATSSDSSASSEYPSIDKAKQSSNVKSKPFVPVLPCVTTASIDPCLKTSYESNTNSTQQKKSSCDAKKLPKINPQDSESSSDVEIIEESLSLQTPLASSKPTSQDKNKITISKSSCSQIKIFSSSSNLKLSTSSSLPTPQMIVSAQSSKGTTIVRPGRSLGTIDGKNITKLTVRPTLTSFKSISTQPSVMGAKKIIIASGLSVRQQNPSSTAMSTSLHLTRKESDMDYVTAPAESSALPAVMTVGASDAFSCMKTSMSTSGHRKSGAVQPVSLVSISTASEDGNKKIVSGALDKISGNVDKLSGNSDKISGNTQEPNDTNVVKDSPHTSTVQVVSTNEAFYSKSTILNLKKIHIGKPGKVQSPAVSASLLKDQSVQDSHTVSPSPPSTGVAETNVIEKNENISSSKAEEILPDSKGKENLDDLVPKLVRKTVDLDNISTFSTFSEVEKNSLPAVPTKVSLLDALTLSTAEESDLIGHTQIASQILDEELKVKDASRTDDHHELELLKNDEHSSSEIPLHSLAEDKPSHSSDSKAVPRRSSSVSPLGPSKVACAGEKNDCLVGFSTSASDPPKIADQVTPINSNLSTTKATEQREADAKSEISLEVTEIIPRRTTTSVGSESTTTSVGSESATSSVGSESASTSVGSESASTSVGSESASTSVGSESASTSVGSESASTSVGSESATTSVGSESATTSVGSESADSMPQTSEDEHSRTVKTPPVPGGPKGTKGASSRSRHGSSKTQKRHSARLSLTPYEGAAQLRSGRKRSK